jgi:hypothetical protein
MDPLEVWNDCVGAAKAKYNRPGYQITKGLILKEAQMAYCAIMVSKLKG